MEYLIIAGIAAFIVLIGLVLLMMDLSRRIVALEVRGQRLHNHVEDLRTSDSLKSYAAVSNAAPAPRHQGPSAGPNSNISPFESSG